MEFAVVGLALIQAVCTLLLVKRIHRHAESTGEVLLGLVEHLIEKQITPTGEMAIVHHRERMARQKPVPEPFQGANAVPTPEMMVYGE